MSGPKKSAYQIQKEKEEALRKQIEAERIRLENQRQLKLEMDKKDNIKAIQDKRAQLKQLTNNLLIVKKKLSFIGALNQAEDSIASLLDRINQLYEKEIRDQDLDSLISQNNHLSHFIKEAQTSISHLEEKTIQLEKQQHGQLLSALDDIIRHSEEAKSSVDNTSASDKDETKEQDDKTNLNELKCRILDEIQDMEDNRAFSKKHGNLIDKVKRVLKGQLNYNSYNIIKDFYSGEYQVLSKKYKSFMTDFNRWNKRFFEVYGSYIDMCQIVGYEPEAYAFLPENAQDLIEQMEYEIEQMEELAYEQKKDAYVRDSIAEIMEEMGYNILAEKDIVKRNQKKVKNKIFTYGEGSAIQVIENNGAITMEIIGLDHGESRVANDDETDFLLDEQKSFCNSFDIIQEKLKRKGIRQNSIMRLPPAREHAKLINLDTYEHIKERVTLITERKDKKKQVSSSQKYKTTEN